MTRAREKYTHMPAGTRTYTIVSTLTSLRFFHFFLSFSFERMGLGFLFLFCFGSSLVNSKWIRLEK